MIVCAAPEAATLQLMIWKKGSYHVTSGFHAPVSLLSGLKKRRESIFSKRVIFFIVSIPFFSSLVVSALLFTVSRNKTE